ncbi:MAG: hypothetical protein HC896_12475 [Bacteroidales bacterium]|nr:hypothetical protein [Bacteroidales bacterium]
MQKGIWLILAGLIAHVQLSIAKPDKFLDTSYVHSPVRASLYSAVVPGLGQIYNGDYYKVPVLYAGMATIVYFLVRYNNKYIDYRNGYADYLKIDGGNHSYQGLRGFYDREQYYYISEDKLRELNKSNLQNGRDTYRRYRDLNVIYFVGLYMLNIVEANVRAHFVYYDIGQDLTIRLKPNIGYGLVTDNLQGGTIGLTLQLRLK